MRLKDCLLALLFLPLFLSAQPLFRQTGPSSFPDSGPVPVQKVIELAKQQDDLYGALNNRLLKGFEYVAKYNLGYDDVPFVTWKDVTGKCSNWTQISGISRGHFIPIYEMVYNHLELYCFMKEPV